MDPFKLLTKGTRLSKAGSGLKSGTFPSAGPARTPQTLPQTVEKTENEVQPRGTKRKRKNKGQDQNAEFVVEAEAPDFFNPKTAEQTQKLSLQPKPDLEGDSAQVGPHEKPYFSKSEEESQQILRKHKLKVTLMNPSISKKKSTDKAKSKLVPITPRPLDDFEELRSRFKISKRLARNLADQGYVTPTEVQLAAIPLLLGNDDDRGLADLSKSKKLKRSHVDLLSIAPTGSGKTLAFLIPLIQGLLDLKHQVTDEDEDKAHVKSIILAPTHELADQIVNEVRKLIQGTGIRVAGMRKGMRILETSNTTDNTTGTETVVTAEILVSTPLVLVNALSDESSISQSISFVRYLVLDEADVLLDPLFREQSLAIWSACTNPLLQLSFWSATIGASIEDLVKDMITTRRKELGQSAKDHHIVRLIAGLKDSSLPTISHRLTYAASEQGKLLAIRQILHPSTSASGLVLPPPFLIFTQTIPRATALHSELMYDIPIEAGGSTRIAVLHSSLSDSARSEIMTRFRKGEIWILITTDLLSRGVDFRGVNGIVNYDIPTTSAAYVHRAGRTGRAGREGGVAITLYTKEDIPYVKNVANVIAASERVHGKKLSASGGEGVPQWLLDALPDVSKKTKKELKQRGVKERRAGVDDSKTRISTKSGFQRREEHRKKGAREASRKRKLEDTAETSDSEVGESDWAGIED